MFEEIKLEGEFFEKKSNKMFEEEVSDEYINQKYLTGEVRLVTEQSYFKLPVIKQEFSTSCYKLEPDYQRRRVWDTVKKSRLIESFIMNIPVPPIFIYEYDFNKYEVMDGLQRLSTIIDFYNDEFELEKLEEWPELNGRKYSQLPDRIREGINRRQLSVIILLRESDRGSDVVNQMKKMVFERLNTGGMKLQSQEIRNALYNGKMNKLCIRLSDNLHFKKIWGIPTYEEESEVYEDLFDSKSDIADGDEFEEKIKNKLYQRMYDVEIILRYFAMRQLEFYTGKLSDFLDEILINGNYYSDETINEMENIFNKVIEVAYNLFGEKAFSQYKEIRKKKKWTEAQKLIYDPMMLALTFLLNEYRSDYANPQKNLVLLKEFYESCKEDDFDGKRQGKNEIEKRTKLLIQFLKSKIFIR